MRTRTMKALIAAMAAPVIVAGCGTPPPPGDTGLMDTSPFDDAADATVPHDHVVGDGHPDARIHDEHADDDALADAAADGDPADASDAMTDGDDGGVFDAGPRTLRTVNGCDPTAPTTVDMTGMSNPTMLARVDFSFAPACIRVRVGQNVVFRVESPTDWRAHPLRAGEVVAGRVFDDLTSPIPFVNMGTADVPVRFDAAGSYPFYCTRHYSLGFVGAVHVVP